MANHAGSTPSWLNSAYIEKIMAESLKKPELKLKSLDISPGSQVGDNYACQIFRISTSYTADGKESQLSLIAKYTVPTKLMESAGGGEAFFVVEAAYYNILAAKIREITGEEDSIGPGVFYTDEEKLILCMEDLKAKDFQLQNRDSLLNLEQCNLVIDAVAILHGCSYYAMKENPDLKKIFHKYFWSSERQDVLLSMVRNGKGAVERNMDKYGLSEEMQKKFLNMFNVVEEHSFKVCDRHDDKLNFLLHGDCWKSNMMFHFNGPTADAVKLLDFQVVNYNSFANDLQYFLFSSVKTDVLQANLDNILQRYYEKLIATAPDIPGVNLERIKKEFEERSFYGLVVSVIFRSIFFADAPPDLDDQLKGEQNDLGYTDPRFISDLKLILPFFDKLGAL